MIGRFCCYWLIFIVAATISACSSFQSAAVSTVVTGNSIRNNLRCPDYQPVTDEMAAAAINVPVERLQALKRARSLTNDDICTMPDKALQRALARLDNPKADHPGEWADFLVARCPRLVREDEAHRDEHGCEVLLPFLHRHYTPAW
mgnify:CR=1 FL=1